MSILTGKTCRSCGLDKPNSDFSAGQNACKECRADYLRQYRQEMSPEKKKEQSFRKNLWRRYRLRPEQYQELLSRGCEICGSMENLCIDHDHECCPSVNTCGTCIRGVLCSRHNQGEGYFKSVEEILSLLAYRLKKRED